MNKSELKKAPLKAKPYFIKCGHRLYVRILPTGQRSFYTRYNKDRKKIVAALGAFDELSIKQAQTLALAHDATGQKKTAGALTWKALSRQFMTQKMAGKSLSHRMRSQRILDKDILPVIGSLTVEQVSRHHWLEILDGVYQRNAPDMCERTRRLGAQIIRWHSLMTDGLENHPQRMAGHYAKKRKQHYAAAETPQELALVVARVRGHAGNPVVKTALELQMVSMLRPGNTIALEWSEVDFDQQQLAIAGHKVKLNGAGAMAESLMQQTHFVPLAPAMIDKLQFLRRITGHGKYVFPAQTLKSKSPTISNNTMNQMLVSCGVSKQQTVVHGFRASAQTLLETVFDCDPRHTDLQLAHAVKGPNGAAYRRGAFLQQRRAMMLLWSDYLDYLETLYLAGKPVTFDAGEFMAQRQNGLTLVTPNVSETQINQRLNALQQ